MKKRKIWKEPSTWVGVFAAGVGVVLTICVYKGVLSGTEYAAALGGVGLFATTIIAVMMNQNKQQ